MQYLTAYFPLHEIADVGPGDTVLVTAASSSAALAAIQLARVLGADVIAQTRTGDKAAAIRKAGANIVIASDHEDLAAGILQYTNGKASRWRTTRSAGTSSIGTPRAADRAKLFFYGLLSSTKLSFELIDPVRKQVEIYPHSLYNHVRDAAELERGVRFLQAKLESGELKPIIDRVFDSRMRCRPSTT